MYIFIYFVPEREKMNEDEKINMNLMGKLHKYTCRSFFLVCNYKAVLCQNKRLFIRKNKSTLKGTGTRD